MSSAIAARATAPASSRPWTAHYPAGIPADIDVAALETLADMLRRILSEFSWGVPADLRPRLEQELAGLRT